MINKKLTTVFFVFGFVGLADAAYLTVKHYLGVPLVCLAATNCEKVLTS
jgi:hypothetical protein